MALLPQEFITIPPYLSQAVAEGFTAHSMDSATLRVVLRRLLHLGFSVSFHQYRQMKGFSMEVTEAFLEALRVPNPINFLQAVHSFFEYLRIQKETFVCPELANILAVKRGGELTRTLTAINKLLIPGTVLEDSATNRIALPIAVSDEEARSFLKEISELNSWNLVKAVCLDGPEGEGRWALYPWENSGKTTARSAGHIFREDLPAPGETYLWDGKDTLLSLFPFLLAYQCRTCGSQHVFGYQDRGSSDIHYEHEETGHTAFFPAKEWCAMLGKFSLFKGDYLQAEKELETALKLGSVEEGLKSTLSLACQKLGDKNYENGSFKAALGYYQRAQGHHPEDRFILFKLGMACFKLNRWQECVDHLSLFSGASNQSAKAQEVMGHAYRALGNNRKAAAAYNQAHQLDPGNPRYREHYLRARRKVQEELATPPPRSNPALPPPQPSGQGGSEETPKLTLSQFVFDLTDEVRAGLIDPIVGREKELAEIEEVLECAFKRNVLIVGEPGAGKTALVHEIARRATSEGASWYLSGKKILQLNVAALIAGARFRGQYEERLLAVVEELKKVENGILFIDDINTFFTSSNNRSGNLDASYVFKPTLARGEIQCIGTCSYEHYRTSLESDPAFMRAFQLVKIPEPSPEDLKLIMENSRQRLQRFHRVTITPEAMQASIDLSKVFIRQRALPDKAIMLLDRACVMAVENPIEEDVSTPSLKVSLDHAVEAASRVSGIPAPRIAAREIGKFLQMEGALASRIKGQQVAIEAVSRVLRVARLNLRLKPSQPDGVFLFCGPTGVGKTELALALTEFLFGDIEKMIRIDMSEYMEHISTSKLIGIAPGYVGYHDKNQLTDRVRQDPYCLVLLDEIEKASPQVLNLFLQVFDSGRLTDSKGNTVYFDNTVFVMTSNVGTDLYGRSVMGFGHEGKKGQELVSRHEMMRQVKSHFPPEFINRIDEIIFFNPLTYEDMVEILQIHLGMLQERIQREFGMSLELEEAAIHKLVELGFSEEFGARELHRAIRSHILDPLARFFMEHPTSRGKRLLIKRVGAIEEAPSSEVEILVREEEEPATDWFTFDVC